MKTVLIRFEARGSSSKILVWLLSWMHCIPYVNDDDSGNDTNKSVFTDEEQ